MFSAQVKETLSHLCIDCPFAQACWNVLHLFIQPGDPLDILSSFRFQLNVVFFMDIIIIMSWCIWMARNDLILRAFSLT
jgi:hypothetical protein